jgi:hypothetical protein
MTVSSSSTDICEELWSSIEYYSEVPSAGRELILSLGASPRSVPKLYTIFRAHVRQARHYYDAAKSTHYRSSSLLYYYSFLNLIKAGIIIRQPTLANSKLVHGLAYKVTKTRTFATETVQAYRGANQIFSLWYQQYTGEPLRSDNLNISNLMGYASDISTQYGLCGFGKGKLHAAYFMAMMDQTDQTGWPLVGIMDYERLSSYAKRLKPFLDDYTQVEVPKSFGLELFKLSAFAHSKVTYFEGTAVPWLAPDSPPSPWDLSIDVATKLNGMSQTNYFKGGSSSNFFVTQPYRPKNQIAFDETLAIYVVMFYLSSLVRYKPEYLDKLLNSKEAWLIENFVKFSSTTFLRGAVSWVINKDYIYERR